MNNVDIQKMYIYRFQYLKKCGGLCFHREVALNEYSLFCLTITRAMEKRKRTSLIR